MKIKKLFLFFLILISLILISCSCENQTTKVKTTNLPTTLSKTTPQTHTIIIQNNKFTPHEIDLSVGDTITWINKDSVKHTITFEDVRIDQALTPSAQISYTFKEPEEARYFCKFHPGMQGNIKVS